MDRLQEYVLDRVQPEPISGCWLWSLSLRADGYGNACVDGTVQVAHRLAYRAFVGPIPGGMCVLHKCDIRACVNPDHLWLGTRAENNLDMWRKGRGNPPCLSGEDHPSAKISAADAIAIYNDPRPHDEIAADYPIESAQVCAIRTGRNWSHVTLNPEVHG